MPPKKQVTDTEKPEAPPKKPSNLKPFGVVIDGQDRTIMAKDEDDLQRQVAHIRATMPTS